jgi:hypothetical protein
MRKSNVAAARLTIVREMPENPASRIYQVSGVTQGNHEIHESHGILREFRVARKFPVVSREFRVNALAK